MADDIPARPEESPTRAAPVTVPVPPAAGNSKLAEAADRIVSIWREHRDGPGLLQIVFHDPVPDDGDPHAELREQLAARGIPRSAVRLTRETGEPVGDSRNDTVSVVITTTDGANIAAAVAHGRDIGVHHLDLPRSELAAQYRAQAVSAAAGDNSASLVFRYVTTGTADSLWREALERKEAFIARVLAGSPGIQADEGPSDSPLSYGELKALAAGSDGSQSAVSECRSDGCDGTPVDSGGYPDGRQPDDRRGLCSTCLYWLDRSAASLPGRIIVEWDKAPDDGSTIAERHKKDGTKPRHVYYLDPGKVVVQAEDPTHLGFGGTPFRVTYLDGRSVETNNLWHQGEIPLRFHHLFPVNATVESLGYYGGERYDKRPPMHKPSGWRATDGPGPASETRLAQSGAASESRLTPLSRHLDWPGSVNDAVAVARTGGSAVSRIVTTARRVAQQVRAARRCP